MSKRVSNSKTNDTRGIKGRQRVRYGWRKQRMFARAFALEAQRRLNAEVAA